MRLQQRLTQSAPQLSVIGFQLGTVCAENPARQRVAVGVKTCRGQRQDSIARLNGSAIDDLLPLHHPHNESRQVVIAHSVHARHLGSLTAYERTACINASPRQTVDYALHQLRHQLAQSYVIEEEQGLGTAGENIVYAWIDQVYAHR